MLAFLIITLLIGLCLNINEKITCSAENDGTKAVRIMLPLKYLTNF